MSGVGEASLVLGIISSVIAIVDGAKQVYDTAEKGEGLPEAFREVAERLPIVRTILASAEKHISDGDIDEPSCKAMKPVIERCGKKAESLNKLFKRVIPPDDASRAERYLKAVRTLGKGGKVETLMRGMLEDIQLLACDYGLKAVTADQIEQIAKAMKEVSEIEASVSDSEFQGTTATNNMFGDGTQNVNNVDGDQYLATGSAKMYNATSMTFEMKDTNFQAKTQNFISSSAFKTSDRLREECEEAVLDLLSFREMDERYEDIAEAHTQTFRWIYEDPKLKFTEWLNSGQGIYWISGKAGCGKSTLMKFLCRNPKTRENLPSDIENVCIAGFFFHDRGPHPLLKSQEGLFRAILHRILSEYRQLISVVLPVQFAKWKKSLASGTNRINNDRWQWKLPELKAAFRGIVEQKICSLRLCLLIDGLDEFSGEHKTIIAVLDELVRLSIDPIVKVQLCLSSRPLIPFENAYLKRLQLKVQDLTAEDINKYVTDEFDKDAHLKELATNDRATSGQIMEEILEKAEGVFLWVTLVVGSLIEGLEEGDEMKDLQKRLSELPAGLEPLYQRMVENIKPRYQEQAAQLFLIVDTAAYHLTSLALSFVDEDPKAVLSFQQGVFSDEEIERRHILVSKRLKSRCVGLIEIRVPRDEALYKSISSANWEAYQVQFLHLTVKEFLTTHKMQNWLATRPSMNTPNIHVRLLSCCIRELQVTDCSEFHRWNTEEKKREAYVEENYFVWSFHRLTGTIHVILFHALQAEKVLHRSQLNYLEALDRLMQATVVSRLPRILERNESEKKLRPPHWTTLRYEDWFEPVQWQSDYVAYLVTIGMARAVTEKIQAGYQPSSKPGRPLLHYAIGNSHIVSDYAIDRNDERDKVDPNIVEGLLEKGCDPNQILKMGEQAEMEYEYGETVWDDILLHIWRRFCSPSPTTELAREYYGQLLEQETAMNDLRLRWLKTFRLLVEYGANVKTPPLTIYSQSLSGRVGFKMSALSIFDDSFAAFDHPLVQSTRELLISKGGTVLKERVSDKDWRFPSGAKKGATSRLACCCSPS